MDTVEWTVSGAQTRSLSYDDEANLVSCLATTDGLLNIITNEYGGGDNGFSFTVHDYFGSGTYEYSWAPGGAGGVSSEVNLGEYSYWYFYNPAPVGTGETPSTCVLSIDGTGDRIRGTIDCIGMPAQFGSLDYAGTSGTQPVIGLQATFDCALL